MALVAQQIAQLRVVIPSDSEHKIQQRSIHIHTHRPAYRPAPKQKEITPDEHWHYFYNTKFILYYYQRITHASTFLDILAEYLCYHYMDNPFNLIHYPDALRDDPISMYAYVSKNPQMWP
jgi:hypothetical protein